MPTLPSSIPRPMLYTLRQQLRRDLPARVCTVPTDSHIRDMPLVLFDFDGTITERDTIDALAQFAILRSHDVVAAAARWRDIVKAYIADYERHVDSYTPRRAERTETAAELKFLESLRGVESASIARVEASGLFRGVESGDFARFGREAVTGGTVTVRKGFGELVEDLATKGCETGVVSVNWSGDFIRGVLDSRRAQRVMANRIRLDGVVEGPPVGVGLAGAEPLLTAGDKVRAAKALVEEWRAVKGGRRDWVYIGDSATDLGCFIESPMGIIMADDEENNKLLQTLKRIGFSVAHVRAWRIPQKLAWARDFDEVLESRLLERWMARQCSA